MTARKCSKVTPFARNDIVGLHTCSPGETMCSKRHHIKHLKHSASHKHREAHLTPPIDCSVSVSAGFCPTITSQGCALSIPLTAVRGRLQGTARRPERPAAGPTQPRPHCAAAQRRPHSPDCPLPGPPACLPAPLLPERAHSAAPRPFHSVSSPACAAAAPIAPAADLVIHKAPAIKTRNTSN